MPKNLNARTRSFLDTLSTIRSSVAQHWVLFAPGALFLCFAVALITAPRFILIVGALFLLSVGGILVYAAWKFMQLKHKFEALAKSIEGKIYIHASQLRAPLDRMESSSDEETHKKIILH